MAMKVEKLDTQERVVELLNAAASFSEDKEKVDNLIKIQELIIHQDPSLLDNFLDEVTAFQHDRSADVRKYIVGFIEEACKTDQELLPKVMNNMQLLLSDSSVAVQKRVIQALTQVYRITLQWLSRSNSVNETMEKTWTVLSQMKSQVSQMIDHDNDGVRTIAVKFYEMLVVSQTYPEPDSIRKENEFSLEDMPFTIKFARPTKLEEEANTMLENLIKFHGSAHISSANLMACMGSLTHIAKSRPQFLDRVVTAMEWLHSNLPPTLSKSQVNSVRKHLKLQLLTILKHPASCNRSETIKSLLTDLGATPQEIAKNLPSPEEIAKNPRRLERSDDSKGAPASKRRKLDASSDQNAPSSDRETLRQNAMKITEEYIVQRLTTRKAAEIAVEALPRVGASMPANFPSVYSPIPDAGSPNQVRQVAKLLATQMTNAGVGPGAEQLKYVPQKGDFEDEEDVEMTDDTITEPVALKKEQDENDPRPGAPTTQPTVPTRPRQRAMKLSEMTKPLSPQANVNLAKAAFNRLLKSERTAMLGGMATTRQKILASLVTLFADDFRELMIEYVMTDPRARIELAFSWLYEEYSMIMGFSCQSSSVSDEQKQMSTESYNTAFCLLANSLRNQIELKEREQLLTRLYLESPIIPEDGVAVLRLMLCDEAKLVEMAIQIVQHLVRRPTKQLVYLNFLLEVSSHEVDDVRSAALSCLTQLYEKGAMRKVIEEYALMHLKFLLLEQPPSVLCGPEKGRNDPVTVWTEEVIKACLYLFLALLRYNEKLIHELAAVYVQAHADIKRKILRMVEEPVEAMGIYSPELLNLVETCPKGAETLLIRVIQIMTDKYPPTPALIEQVRNLYQHRVPDVRFLIPVLNGLTKKEVLAVLPKLIKLNPDVVKRVFQRLLGSQAEGQSSHPSPLLPSELLIALHNIDPSKCDLMVVIKATSLCFAEKSIYTQEVLGSVIQQLMEQNPLPTLLMRTVLQALSLYPKLLGFVMNTMQRLIVKQVWKQKKVWEGFIKCCQRTKPHSFGVILQLPPQILQELLNTAPDLKMPLLEHVMSTENHRLHLPKLTMDVLNGIAQFQSEAEEANAEENEKQMGSPEPVEAGLQQDNEPPVPGDF